MKRQSREHVWVHRFQTKLTLRIGLYMALFLIVLVNFLFMWRLWVEGVHDPAEQFVRMLSDNLPVGVCLLALAPVVVWDAVRFTHRLVGPLARFRQTFRDVGEGRPVVPIELREGDYLGDLRDDVNFLLKALESAGMTVLKPADAVENKEHTPV